VRLLRPLGRFAGFVWFRSGLALNNARRRRNDVNVLVTRRDAL